MLTYHANLVKQHRDFYCNRPLLLDDNIASKTGRGISTGFLIGGYKECYALSAKDVGTSLDEGIRTFFLDSIGKRKKATTNFL